MGRNSISYNNNMNMNNNSAPGFGSSTPRFGSQVPSSGPWPGPISPDSARGSSSAVGHEARPVMIRRDTLQPIEAVRVLDFSIEKVSSDMSGGDSSQASINTTSPNTANGGSEVGTWLSVPKQQFSPISASANNKNENNNSGRDVSTRGGGGGGGHSKRAAAPHVGTCTGSYSLQASPPALFQPAPTEVVGIAVGSPSASHARFNYSHSSATTSPADSEHCGNNSQQPWSRQPPVPPYGSPRYGQQQLSPLTRRDMGHDEAASGYSTSHGSPRSRVHASAQDHHPHSSLESRSGNQRDFEGSTPGLLGLSSSGCKAGGGIIKSWPRYQKRSSLTSEEEHEFIITGESSKRPSSAWGNPTKEELTRLVQNLLPPVSSARRGAIEHASDHHVQQRHQQGQQQSQHWRRGNRSDSDAAGLASTGCNFKNTATSPRHVHARDGVQRKEILGHQEGGALLPKRRGAKGTREFILRAHVGGELGIRPGVVHDVQVRSQGHATERVRCVAGAVSLDVSVMLHPESEVSMRCRSESEEGGLEWGVWSRCVKIGQGWKGENLVEVDASPTLTHHHLDRQNRPEPSPRRQKHQHQRRAPPRIAAYIHSRGFLDDVDRLGGVTPRDCGRSKVEEEWARIEADARAAHEREIEAIIRGGGVACLGGKEKM